MLKQRNTYVNARIQVDNSLRALTAGKRHKVAEHQNELRALMAEGKTPPKKKPYVLQRFDLRLKKLRDLADRLFIEQVKHPERRFVRIARELRELVNSPLKGLI